MTQPEERSFKIKKTSKGGFLDATKSNNVFYCILLGIHKRYLSTLDCCSFCV